MQRNSWASQLPETRHPCNRRSDPPWHWIPCLGGSRSARSSRVLITRAPTRREPRWTSWRRFHVPAADLGQRLNNRGVLPAAALTPTSSRTSSRAGASARSTAASGGAAAASPATAAGRTAHLPERGEVRRPSHRGLARGVGRLVTLGSHAASAAPRLPTRRARGHHPSARGRGRGVLRRRGGIVHARFLEFCGLSREKHLHGDGVTPLSSALDPRGRAAHARRHYLSTSAPVVVPRPSSLSDAPWYGDEARINGGPGKPCAAQINTAADGAPSNPHETRMWRREDPSTGRRGNTTR